MRDLFSQPWNKVIEDKTRRLRSPLNWYPWPILISFGLVTLLSGHAIFGTSSKLGHPAQLLKFPGDPFKTGGIWFSVTPVEMDIVVTTEDRRVFRWDQNVENLAQIKPFVDYLVEKTQAIAESGVLSKDPLLRSTRAVIAADQRLKYLHFRPILYALAEAKITRYGFETQSPEVAINADYLKKIESEKAGM